MISEFLRDEGDKTREAARPFHLVFLAVTVLTIFLIHFFLNFEGLSTPDAYNLAQIARNIALGEGFTTDVIDPLAWSNFPRTQNHPDFQYPPLYPHLVAAGFLLTGVKAAVPIVISGISYLCITIVSYFIVLRLFNARSAFFSSLLLSTFYYFVLFGFMGRTESLYILLVLASVLVSLWDGDNPYFLGGISGLAYLTRFNHWFILIGILIFVFSKPRKTQLGYFRKFFSTFLLVTSPYLVRNTLLMGNPLYHDQVYELVSDTVYYPGFEINLAFNPPDPWLFALTHPAAILSKWGSNLMVVYRTLPELFTMGWPILILAVLGLARNMDRGLSRSEKGIITIFGVGFLLQWLLLSLVRARIRYYVPFLPVVFFFAGKEFNSLVCSHKRKFGYLLLAIVIAINLSFSFQLETANPRNVSKLTEVQEDVPRKEPILTNIPQILAWTTDRSSLALVPLETAEKNYGAINYVILSSIPEALISRKDTRKFVESEKFREEFELIRKYSGARFRLFRRTVSKNISP